MSEDPLDKLKKALESSPYSAAPGNLQHGAPLIMEQLDLSGIGMYDQIQKDALVASGVPEDDFFLKTLRFIGTMWARKSDEGKKWHVYNDTGIKLHKDLK